jgi:hypothetical protein
MFKKSLNRNYVMREKGKISNNANMELKNVTFDP